MLSRWYAVALILVFTPALRADSREKELEKFLGTWSVEAIEENGLKESDDEIKRFTVVIRNATIIVNLGGREETMAFKIDPGQSPKCIDLIPNFGADKGKLSKGIYELNGDRLRIHARPYGERPTEFVSELGMFVLVLKKKT